MTGYFGAKETAAELNFSGMIMATGLLVATGANTLHFFQSK
jgi:hypothetical protein